MTALAAIRMSPRVIDGSGLASDGSFDADVCIVGSGAGGAVTAAVLAAAGKSVILVEEGGYYTSDEFTTRERDMMPRLYQEGGQRVTADAGISILQGRAVGGTTVVNWTTSFRTPQDVVEHWAKKHAVGGFGYQDLVPHWDWIEKRLGIAKVTPESMNPNNRVLYDGCKKLGWDVDTLKRNVHGCQQTGMCGLGCPVNAKRSMLVTMVPDAVDQGARVLFRARAMRFEMDGSRVRSLEGVLLDASGRNPTGKTFSVRAKRFIASGGAINSPALLLRSGIEDEGRVGRRTFLHPVVGSAGIYGEEIKPSMGAPQSAASHEFAHRGDDIGYFIEAVPWYPALASAVLPGFGAEHAHGMTLAAHSALHVAITIDGFHDDIVGGTVRLRPSGLPVLDYPITDRQWDTFRHAQKKLAEMQLASGATTVLTLHDPPTAIASMRDLRRIDAARYEVGSVPIFSAHQMGGCTMGDEPATSVVRSQDLRHHRIENLHVVDGSVFPTSLGVNPQESIYGLARLMATRIAALG